MEGFFCISVSTSSKGKTKTQANWWRSFPSFACVLDKFDPINGVTTFGKHLATHVIPQLEFLIRSEESDGPLSSVDPDYQWKAFVNDPCHNQVEIQTHTDVILVNHELDYPPKYMSVFSQGILASLHLLRKSCQCRAEVILKLRSCLTLVC